MSSGGDIKDDAHVRAKACADASPQTTSSTGFPDCPHAVTPIQNLAVSIVQPDWGALQQRQVGDLPADLLFRGVDRKRRKSAQRKLKRLHTPDLLLNLPYMVKKGLQQWHSGEKASRRPARQPGWWIKKNLQR